MDDLKSKYQDEIAEETLVFLEAERKRLNGIFNWTALACLVFTLVCVFSVVRQYSDSELAQIIGLAFAIQAAYYCLGHTQVDRYSETTERAIREIVNTKSMLYKLKVMNEGAEDND